MNTEEIRAVIDSLEFEPSHRWQQSGSETQLCTAVYNKVLIQCYTHFPWSFLSKPSNWFCLDLILPMHTYIADGHMENAGFYGEDGSGYPQFETLESAIVWIANSMVNLKDNL